MLVYLNVLKKKAYFEKIKELAERQYTQADKLLGRLEHYASENSVPREWR